MKPRPEKFDPPWEQCLTLYQWAEKMLREGHWQIVRDLAVTFPKGSETRNRLRDLYVMVMQEKKQNEG